MKNQKDGYYKNEHCRIDADAIHTLPLTASRQRIPFYKNSRKFGDLTMTMKAAESLNAYDLITLGQLLQDYQERPESWSDAGTMRIDDSGAGRNLIYKKLNLAQMAKEKGLSSHKHNRQTIFDSITRWYRAELMYQYDGESIIHTRYVFEVKENIDAEGMCREVDIVVNQNFFDLCLQEGLVFNWRRLVGYGDKFYAIQLDAYLQSNKVKTEGGYVYRSTIKEETLFKALGLDKTHMEQFTKRAKLKGAFKTIEEAGLPKYLLDTENKRWVRESAISALSVK